MVDLDFKSPNSLKESIKAKYPDLSTEAQEATFQDHKKYIGESTEKILDRQWKQYKLDNGLP